MHVCIHTIYNYSPMCVCINLFVYVCMYLLMYVWMDGCMYVCMSAYTHMRTPTCLHAYHTCVCMYGCDAFFCLSWPRDCRRHVILLFRHPLALFKRCEVREVDGALPHVLCKLIAAKRATKCLRGQSSRFRAQKLERSFLASSIVWTPSNSIPSCILYITSCICS